MKIFVCNIFSSKIFARNQAGAVLLEENKKFLDESLIKNIAGELKHLETAFVKK